MSSTQSTIALDVFNVLKSGARVPWTPEQIAEYLGIELRSAALACTRLVALGAAEVVGGSQREGILYQWRPGTEPPSDLRGKHGQHQTGAAWSAVRKRTMALSRARATRAAKAAIRANALMNWRSVREDEEKEE